VGEQGRNDNLPCCSIPYPDTSVQTARSDSHAVKGNSVYLAVMALQSVEAPSLGNAPNLGGSVIATRDYDIALDLQAPDASLVAYKDVPTQTGSYVPHPEGSIARS